MMPPQPSSGLKRLVTDQVQKEAGPSSSASSSDDTDEDDLTKLDKRLKQQFTEEIRDLAKPKSHRKVAVLLLSWEVEHPDDMDTSEEVGDLRAVLEDQYNFTVRTHLMNTRQKQPAKHQLNYGLSKFLRDHDGKDTLLIIYYGGHGMMGSEDRKLRFVPNNPSSKEDKEWTEIVWTKSAVLLEDTVADRLLIFDCCHAGILEREHRSPKEHPMYEFIGSTPFNKTARGPDKHSFTRALINGFKQLSSKRQGFSTWELLHAIKTSDDFLHTGQQPVSSEIGPHASFKKLQITPLSSKLHSPSTQTSLEDTQTAAFRCSLTLRYTFSQKPTETHITNMTRSLTQLVNHDGVPVRSVHWIKLAKLGFADAVHSLLTHQRRSSTASIGSSEIASPKSYDSGSQVILQPIPEDENADYTEKGLPSTRHERFLQRSDTQFSDRSNYYNEPLEDVAAEKPKIGYLLCAFALGYTFAVAPDIYRFMLQLREWWLLETLFSAATSN